MKNITLLIIILSALSLSVFSQQKVVRGNVYAFKDLYLKNIKVEAKKSGAMIKTDSMGNFTIVCEKKDKLIFTGMGFNRYVKNVNKSDSLIIKMVFAGGDKNEEVAIGYGHVSQNDLTFAVSHFSYLNNDYSNYTDIFQLIQGKFAGVQVVNASGTKKILVRGVSSNTTNIYAIYVVDGVKTSDISHISPTWVKSIDVLKDGGGSIYGAQGGTGVVLINTIRAVE